MDTLLITTNTNGVYLWVLDNPLITSTCGLQISKWYKYTMQAPYIINFTYHCAINMTPYEAVFHMKAKRELLDHGLEEG